MWSSNCDQDAIVDPTDQWSHRSHCPGNERGLGALTESWVCLLFLWFGQQFLGVYHTTFWACAMLYLVKSVFSFKVLVCTSLVTFEMLDKDGGCCPLSVSSPTTHVTGHHQGTVQVHIWTAHMHSAKSHTSLCNNEQYILHRVKLTAPSKPNLAYTCIVVHSVTLQTKSLLPGVVVPQTALCHSSHPSSSHHARPIQALLPHNFSPKFLPLSFPDSSIPCLCVSPLPTYSHIL